MMHKNQRIQRLPQSVSGIRCPNCGNSIPISLHQILFSNDLFCPTCGLRINIDKRKSDKALEMRKRVEEAQKKSEASLQVSK